MSGTIDERVKGTPTYTKPFEMRFVAEKQPDGTAITGAEVYVGGVRIRGIADLFSDSECHFYTPRHLAKEMVALLLPGESTIQLYLDMHGPELTLKDDGDGKIGVRIKEQGTKDPCFTKVPSAVVLPKEEVVYTIARYLNDWLTYYAKKGAHEKEFSEYKMCALELFNHPAICRRFEQDGIQTYDFAGVPDITESIFVEANSRELDGLLLLLEKEHWNGLVEGKRQTSDGYAYALPTGREAKIIITQTEQNKERKIFEISFPEQDDEQLWEPLIRWAKKIRTTEKDIPGKGTLYVRE